MRVFKFGGASVSTVERIRQVGEIVREQSGSPLLIVVSAMGKTTNALEKVAEAFYAGKKEEALQLFEAVKQSHLTMAKYLLVKESIAADQELLNFFTEVEWLLHDKPVREYDYYYDQIVCTGELLSTCIVSHYFREEGIPNTWFDVRDILRTDEHFREANIDFDFTAQQTETRIKPALSGNGIVLTQGFIGATQDNESTTLGREGSDYTAAVFANLLDAESVTIWKDVEGVMNADPKQFPDATVMPELNYREVIEMAYYGAQVIHPKTIKPIENKGIPLYVKSFIDPSLPGTCIRKQAVSGLPPVIVLKKNQVLLHLKSKDFSFVGEKPVAEFYLLAGKMQLRPNLTQNGAITFLCCMDDYGEKLDQLAHEAGAWFDVIVEKELSLLTIRHYDEPTVTRMIARKDILLKQETRETIQVLGRF
ncbi:aspartate kinase [Parasegetibacter sp. NRK P23]|uniref:aspartate kinase n=1 Tax=Parasegetibacter sp. NRK P23 TaxID=2942999 RepID=UPI002042F992|nr:aspartate kinase [Parasegetibacter sp. NRK P23]MCM5528253.1 aspartate kinase [Parasegetibacter sp. NRK P23]